MPLQPDGGTSREPAQGRLPGFPDPADSKNICLDAMHEMSQYEEKISRLYGTPVRKWSLGEVSLKELCAQVEEEINRRL